MGQSSETTTAPKTSLTTGNVLENPMNKEVMPMDTAKEDIEIYSVKFSTKPNGNYIKYDTNYYLLRILDTFNKTLHFTD